MAYLLLCLALAQLHTVLLLSSTHHVHGHSGNLIDDHLPVPFLCHPEQAKVLLQLKKSFSFGYSTTTLSSWRDGTDCCFWEGVGCDTSSGNVTVLDLNNRGLFSHGLDPALFSLTSLRRLDLSMNEFSGDPVGNGIEMADNIPATGFERFTWLTHLNLSNLGLRGPIPVGIGELVNLLSLDLSNYFASDEYDVPDDSFFYDNYNALWVPSFDTLVANLSNLRELYLDRVDLSRIGEEWCTSLATYVPHLQVLSLANCGLTGPFCTSLSRLVSLVVLDLQGNEDMTAGPFPEFFLDFTNLTILRLSTTNLTGWFPFKPFQSKILRVLELSNNPFLSGHVPNFSNASSLETLMLDETNFLPAKPMSSSNFKSLKELVLDANLVSVDFLSSFGTIGSSCQLDLRIKSVSELGSIFAVIGKHKNLVSLVLSDCDLSGITPNLFSNFKTLTRLTMLYSNIPKLVLGAVGNLISLRTLEIDGCTTYGSMPSSIGNLTNLRNMYISYCWIPGPMPAAIGNLANLRNMYIDACQFSGPMPATIGKLTNTESMHINGGFSGPMPATIGNLTNLKTIYVQAQFSGAMPDTIGNLTHLKSMGFVGGFSGSLIPYTIGQLSQLESFDIRYSNFSGSIYTEFNDKFDSVNRADSCI